MRYIFSTLTLALLSACGVSSDGDNNADTKKLDKARYLVVEAGTLKHTSSEISGQGSIAFLNPTKDKGNSYALKAGLQDGGSLALVGNSEEGLKNGVEVKFSRSAKKLAVAITVGGESIDATESFSDVDASKDLDLQIDLHNDESPVHVLIWSQDADTFDDETALFNSESDTETTGQGSGNIWGFVLSKATLSKASVSEPKFEDD